MDIQERENRLEQLYNDQNKLFPNLTLSELEIINVKEYTPQIIEDFSIPFHALNNLEKLEDFDESIFAKWKTADLPVMFVAGGLGTLSSVLLRDFFADLHDNNFGKKTTDKHGHSRENVDWVPGAKQPGGFGHRWKYGHDIFNPFEVNWDQYLEIAKKSGGNIPPWLKAVFYWLRHLLQDTFSKEGLPLPGHSLLRKFLNFNNPKTRELLQFLGTMKMRDIAGSAVANIVMGSYLWGTEKSIKRVVIEPNYRAFSLMLGANVVTLLSGLLVPPPATSLNWGAIPVIAYYSIQIIRMEKRIRNELNGREEILNENDQVLIENEAMLNNISISNGEYYNNVIKYEKDIEKYYIEAISNHKKVKSLFEGA